MVLMSHSKSSPRVLPGGGCAPRRRRRAATSSSAVRRMPGGTDWRQAIDVARHVHTRQACIRAETGVLPLSTHRHNRGKQVRRLHLATHTALQNVADDAIADAVMAISMRAARQTTLRRQ